MSGGGNRAEEDVKVTTEEKSTQFTMSTKSYKIDHSKEVGWSC